ncbi:hypothetical protein BGZ65_006262 [Modicella reniformis]|uniref:Uncharacterized protein n=1 Tax=Modicella reniformis TaxID=1440133 RepID=A0A9P6JH77_9FUNG|nr:hypothetical protein BGZ65_006262 [Modicella reniformis]
MLVLPLWDDQGIWKKVDIDLSAVIEGTRPGILALKKQGHGGVIINTASLAGLYPQTLTPVYSAAKFGVIGLTRSFKDYGNNIRVNAAVPSFSDTKIISQVKELVMSMAPLVPVEQVIDAFMMLIKDDSYSGDVARITTRSSKPFKLQQAQKICTTQRQIGTTLDRNGEGDPEPPTHSTVRISIFRSHKAVNF